jgi:serine protease
MRTIRLAALTAAVATAFTMSVSTSSAAGHSHFGMKPIAKGAVRNAPAANADTLSLQTNGKSGVVSPTPKVYLVFWGSQWSKDPAKVAPDMQAMFKGLYGASDTWGNILSQYCENAPVGTTKCPSTATFVKHPAASILGGVWFDNGSAAPASATAAQIGSEASKAAGHFGNKTQTPNLNAQYVILSATGTHPDGFPNSGFCAWHDFTSTSYGKLAYTNLPYVPDMGAGACTTLTDGRMLSGIESTETHEYAETVTDFWPTDGWNNTANGEIGDECVNLDAYETLTTGKFDVQGLWSNKANACVTHG